MPYLTTSRGLLGHFLHGADLPATDNQSSPLPVRFPIYLSLWAILAAGARRGGAGGGAGGRRSLRDGGGEGGGSGGRIRDGGGATSGASGDVKRKMEATNTTAARERGERHEPTVQVSSDGAGRGYRAYGTDQDESADKSS